MTRLVLGSGSPGRLKVLRQAGVDPLVVVSGIDEDAVITELGDGADPADVTTALAAAKAHRAAELLEPAIAADCAVIGCDSMLFLDDRLCGKPHSVAEARQQWVSMAGRAAQLLTGHCLIRLCGNEVAYRDTAQSVSTVRFGTPLPADLDAYLQTGESLSVAGGFTLDGLGGWFIDAVEGDPLSVIGISLAVTRRLLQSAGLSISTLWRGR
ncbi:Maf family nucleotide pyrophosphatase [Mycobacterium sp.]|uniref:Maf family protein n=1 Tax=Mycobacterium sp. TaxID=1785 RepID=UPI0012854284|nr:Maf family nucleotide pyrophosphatase [Mycobacterium sp.]KAA8968270.1 MAG: septum formation inhibitor Maf [Mycobacterium sp.]